MNKLAMYTAVFLSGLSVMIFELVAPRIYAPFLGTSTYIWTIVIGVVMTSLSVGYFLGGKLSNNKHGLAILASSLFVAGLLILAVAITKDMILVSTMGQGKNVILRAITLSIILLGPVNVLLGMTTPIGIGALIKSKKDAGKLAGNVFAISTLGSIVGTFTVGLWLIPTFGVQTILYLVSLILMITGTLIATSLRMKILLLTIAITTSMSYVYLDPKNIFVNYFQKIYRANLVADFDTSYNRVWIYDLFSGVDTLRILSNSQSERRINQSIEEEIENNISYLKYFEIARFYLGEIRDALMIGGGVYIYPSYVSEAHPETHMDVVEIDPELISVAKEYFGYKESRRISSFAMDGRVFLNLNTKKYDAIYLDAYRNGDAIPFQLATIEAYGKMHNSLHDNGILMVNIIGAMEGEDSRLFQSQIKTIAEVFNEVKVYPVTTKDIHRRQNLIVVAIKGAMNTPKPETRTWMKKILLSEIDYTDKSKSDWPTMTDNYAPLEYYDLKHYF